MFLSNNSHDRNCPQPEARIGNVRRPGNSMDRNLITRKNIVIRDFFTVCSWSDNSDP